MKIKKDIIYDLLPNGLQLMEHLGLEGSSPCSLTCSEAMKGVIVENDRRALVDENPRHGLQ